MNYTESYTFLDWPLESGQLLAGLDVQLPGSDRLLPPADGYLVEPTTTSSQETRHHPKDSHFLDFAVDSDWINFDVNEHFGDDFGLDSEELLPSSPEVVSYDLNAVDFSQVIDSTAFSEKPEVFTKALGRNSVPEDVSPSSEVILGVAHLVSEDPGCEIKGHNFDEDGCLQEFDSDWLLSSVPSLPPVSLEEVESILSASPPTDGICGEEKWDFLESELEAYKTEAVQQPMPSSFEELRLGSLYVPSSPLSIVLAACPEQGISRLTTTCSLQVPPNNIGWQCGGVVGNSFDGFRTVSNTLLLTTSSGSLPGVEISSVDSPGGAGDSGSDIGPIASDRSSYSPVRAEPYQTTGVKPERHERKREQNKTAALKYRQKKRSAQGTFVSECEQLEKRNLELKSRAEELTREINYLKGLISEIYSNQIE